jgi:hypothetical protein
MESMRKLKAQLQKNRQPHAVLRFFHLTLWILIAASLSLHSPLAEAKRHRTRHLKSTQQPPPEDLVTEASDVPQKTISDTTPSPPPPVQLENAEFLTTLKAAPQEEGKTVPHFHLFKARLCAQCEGDLGIFAINADQPKAPPHTFIYPGKIQDRKTGKTLFESRAFYGRCVRKKSSDVYVVFQKDLSEKKRRVQTSVLIATPGQQFLEEELLEKHLPSLQDAIQFTQRKHCKEIIGKSRISLARPFDVDLRRKASDEDRDDDDDDTPSNKAGGEEEALSPKKESNA